MTGAPGSVTFYEWGRPEVFEAGAWARESLATTLSPSCCVLKCKHVRPGLCVLSDTNHSKAVANPEVIPVSGAVRNIHVLAVDCNHIGLNLTNNTPGKKEI